MDKHNFDIIY